MSVKKTSTEDLKRRLVERMTGTLLGSLMDDKSAPKFDLLTEDGDTISCPNHIADLILKQIESSYNACVGGLTAILIAKHENPETDIMPTINNCFSIFREWQISTKDFTEVVHEDVCDHANNAKRELYETFADDVTHQTTHNSDHKVHTLKIGLDSVDSIQTVFAATFLDYIHSMSKIVKGTGTHGDAVWERFSQRMKDFELAFINYIFQNSPDYKPTLNG